MGHRVELLPAFTAGVGGAQGVLFNLDTGTMTAGADPRRAGLRWVVTLLVISLAKHPGPFGEGEQPRPRRGRLDAVGGEDAGFVPGARGDWSQPTAWSTSVTAGRGKRQAGPAHATLWPAASGSDAAPRRDHHAPDRRSGRAGGRCEEAFDTFLVDAADGADLAVLADRTPSRPGTGGWAGRRRRQQRDNSASEALSPSTPPHDCSNTSAPLPRQRSSARSGHRAGPRESTLSSGGGRPA